MKSILCARSLEDHRGKSESKDKDVNIHDLRWVLKYKAGLSNVGDFKSVSGTISIVLAGSRLVWSLCGHLC